MKRVPELREIPELPDEIIQAAQDGSLVLFIGSGLSRLLGLPSWSGMARQQLKFLREEGAINFSEMDQLITSIDDPRKQLSIAREIADENSLDLDLKHGLTDYSEGDSIYRIVNGIGCVCVTTNYDELLAPRYKGTEDGSETSMSVTRIYQKHEFLVTHLDSPGTVIHLHGSVRDQSTMVVTTKDYLEHYDDRFVKDFLGDLFDRKTVLFLGYGLDEAEVLEHILRRGRVGKGPERRRFVLQGYYLSQRPLYKSLHAYYRNSFGVHVIGFVRDHKDYHQQEAILADWAPKIIVREPPLAAGLALINEVFDD